jgi:hypothetical protein
MDGVGGVSEYTNGEWCLLILSAIHGVVACVSAVGHIGQLPQCVRATIHYLHDDRLVAFQLPRVPVIEAHHPLHHTVPHGRYRPAGGVVPRGADVAPTDGAGERRRERRQPATDRSAACVGVGRGHSQDPRMTLRAEAVPGARTGCAVDCLWQVLGRRPARAFSILNFNLTRTGVDWEIALKTARVNK